MRSYDAATLAALQTRAGVCVRLLIWVVAKNRTTGDPEALGLWTGAYDREFTIGAETRLYAGAGAIVQIPPLKMQAGLSVRMQRFTLSPIAPVVADLIETYQSRLAPIEIHRALFSTEDGSLVAEPHRVWKGFIDEVEITRPEAGGEATCEVTAASSARLLTRTLPLKRSDATQQLRSGDRFRRYVDISGKVDVWWGERKGGGSGGGNSFFGIDTDRPAAPRPPNFTQIGSPSSSPSKPGGGLGSLLGRR